MIFLIVGFIALVVLIVLFLLPKGRYLLIIPPAVYVAIVLTGVLPKSNDPMMMCGNSNLLSLNSLPSPCLSSRVWLFW